jgi:hypothetical protein
MNRIAIFSLVLLAAIGCRENKTTGWPDTPVETATSTGAVIDPTVTGTDADRVEPDTAAGATVLVVLEDTTVGLPTTDIAPGPTVFTVTNSGSEVHDLRIEGAGISVEVEGTIEPGQTKTVNVDLKPGAYEAYCPILDHRKRGQRAQFTIAAP